MGIENPVHLLFVAVVALIVLGPRRLPELARSLGRGIREFREAMSNGSATGSPHTPAPPSAPAAPSQPVPAAPPPEPAPSQQVNPPEPVRSGDHAPDRRSL
jgi:TatA/E family protein of Tat protein translocase